MMWKKFPENKPSESSYYYYTYYYNSEKDEKYYKAFQWIKTDHLPKEQVHQDLGGFWMFRIKPEVIAFIEESKNEYYVPCQMWAWENVKEKYEDSFNK